MASNADPFECVQANSPAVPLLINQGLNDYSSEWRTFDAGFQKLKTKWQLGAGKVIAGNSSCSRNGNSIAQSLVALARALPIGMESAFALAAMDALPLPLRRNGSNRTSA